MTKYVIDTVELKKRQYVIDAFSEREAIDKMEDAEPILQEIVSDSIFGIHTINEYEYNKDWKPKWEEYKKQWKREKKDHEGYQYDAFHDEADLFRDD